MKGNGWFRHLWLASFLALAGCPQPPHGSPPPERVTYEERGRAHPLHSPGFVGSSTDYTYFVEMQADKANPSLKHPVLVEEDRKRRDVGFAYLDGLPVRALVGDDVVILATTYVLACYDVGLHEMRWRHSYADDDKEIDDFARRGDKLDVSLEGGMTVTLSVSTGMKTIP